MSLVVVFLGIMAGVVAGVYGINSIDKPPSGVVLSQQTEASQHSAPPSFTPVPTLSPTPLPPTSTSTPTPRPTSKPTLIPTPISSPTPLPQATPTAPPIPTSPAAYAPVTAPSDLEPLFVEFSLKYGVDTNLMKKIAKCESNFNRGVVSGNGLYAGLFQFGIPLWSSQRSLMGLDANPDLRFGARESIETAAYVISHWGTHAWPTCSK